MEKLAMIETLRERADITYEEAKEVLEQANDDLLEAIVILEKQGKIRTDKTVHHAEANGTQSGEMENHAINEDAKAHESVHAGKAIRSAFGFVLHTSFHVKRRGRELFTMPTWILAILLPAFWGIAIPVLLAALFFECRYSFSGPGNIEAANEFFDKAGSFADGVESGLQKEA